ncbi:ABC transporter permease [Nocardioides sp. TF02-7]|uniref:ABC transporter permease n=1 Tax=Nocardioides sp. TF02-7 TaxID=2917724 RepID=UPI001F06AB43|nr:ABC transporter permease [Nocardioides sp. TF02-7]UMG92737.1 ABC transporter permease [Nocardioides sp. TF02-7]
MSVTLSRAVRTTPRRPAVVWFSYAVLAVVAVVVLLADLLAPHAPNEQNLTAILQSPSWQHPLGTDDLGRDVLSRMIHGTRVSILAAAWAVGIAVVVGFPLGVLTGYVRGVTDAAVMRVLDALMAFPALVLAIGITAMLGPDIMTAMTAVGVVLTPVIVRLARAQTMAITQQTYIEAARSFGARGARRMIIPHVVPNVVQPIVAQVAVLAGFALIAEASLSFVQLGVQPPTASWGTVLARSYTFLELAPWSTVVPGAAIALTVFSLNILGEEIQRMLDPRRR